MRVLLIIVRSDFGGGPRHVHQLVEHLPAIVELYMAYPEVGDPYADLWKNKSNIKGTCFIPYRKFSIKTLFRLKKFIKQNKIDIVHSHGNGAGLYSRILKILGCKVKVVHTFHGITVNYSSFLKKIANQVSGFILRPFTNRFILVGKGELELGEKIGVLNDTRSSVIYNGIETPLEVIKKTNNAINIVTLSRFDYQKNMDLAYEIASKLKSHKEICFIWVGDGDDMERLKNQADKENLNIKFIGFSKEPMKYLAEADLYLSTSRFEGLPYALIEASSMSLPIIATNVIGNNECVDDGETGYLFDTCEEAVDKIEYLVSDKSKIDEMSHKSREFFCANFTIEKMLSDLLNVYNSI